MIHKALLGSTLLALSMVFGSAVMAASGQSERANLKEAHDPLSLNSSVALGPTQIPSKCCMPKTLLRWFQLRRLPKS